MKHFILEGKHLAPFERFAHLEPEHHNFLQKGYASGAFLFSGPQVPAHGGFLAARAESREQLDALLAEEPFVKNGYMQFISVSEFDPIQHQPFLREWFAGMPVDTGKDSIGEQLAASRGAREVANHFLLEGEHIVPLEQRDPALIAAHRRFLQRGYDNGDFLMSGPTIPPMGGVLVARAESLKELGDMLAEEPYVRATVMRFKRITQFSALQRQPVLDGWFAGKVVDQIERATAAQEENK